MQKAAEQLVEEGLADIEKRRGYKYPPRGKQEIAKDGRPDYLQGALVRDGSDDRLRRAMVGGRDFSESRFNRAVQAKRQSGSAFKPFVYATAIEAGYTPATVITNLDDPIATPQGGWVPEDEHSDADSMTLRTALRTSSNRAAVQLLNSVGIKNAVGYAEKLNVGTPPSVPSLALGASEVTLAQLTAAYGAFANKGVVREPLLIRRVEDGDGKILYQAVAKSHQAISETTAYLMSSMLADVISVGDGVPRPPDRVHAAGGGQDRHDQRLQRRVVRRLHAAPRHRRVGRLRSAQDDHLERLRRRCGGPDLGRRS